MTTDQAANYGTLLGVFLVAAFAQWNARKAHLVATEAKAQTTEIHNLVNGGRLLDLSKVVELTKRISEITSSPEDAAAYQRAVVDFQAHQAKFTPVLTTPSPPTTTPS